MTSLFTRFALSDYKTFYSALSFLNTSGVSLSRNCYASVIILSCSVILGIYPIKSLIFWFMAYNVLLGNAVLSSDSYDWDFIIGVVGYEGCFMTFSYFTDILATNSLTNFTIASTSLSAT